MGIILGDYYSMNHRNNLCNDFPREQKHERSALISPVRIFWYLASLGDHLSKDHVFDRNFYLQSDSKTESGSGVIE